MRDKPGPQLEQARVVNGKTTPEMGMLGVFLFEAGDHLFTATSSGIDGWEHVALASDRDVVWSDVLLARTLFWRDDELVVMFVEGEAIHLWHALRDEVPVPWRKPCTDE